MGRRKSLAVAGLLVGSVLMPSSGVGSPSAANGPIVFESTRDGNPEIYVMQPDGRGVRRLTKESAQDSTPHWSPDGTQIYFASDRSGDWQLYRMTADGGKQTRIATSTTAFAPRVTPDGKQIAFESFDARGRATVHIVSTRGGDERNLTPAGLEDTAPSWAPGGNRLVLSRGSPMTGLFSLSVVDATNGRARRLTKPPQGASDSEPDWSPSGKQVAFTRLSRNGNYDVVVAAATAGSRVRRLTKDANEDGGPVWSPDGRLLIFRSSRKGAYDLWRMNADGTKQVQLTRARRGVSVAADWAPGKAAALASSARPQRTMARTAGYFCVTPPGGSPPTSGHDVIKGTPYVDYLCGAGGPDWIHGYASGDQITGGSGNDRPAASSILAGDGGDDLFYARAFSAPTGDCDYVDGGDGPDTAWVDKSPVTCGNGTYKTDVWVNVSVTRPP